MSYWPKWLKELMMNILSQDNKKMKGANNKNMKER